MRPILRHIGIVDVQFGDQVVVIEPVNLYGCVLGDHVFVGPFVEIQANVRIGHRTRIQSHSFICEGVTIEDQVFVGHHVVFINDRYPRAVNQGGELQTEVDWTMEPTVVKRRASIGSGAVILCNVTVGENAMVGAGSVVTKDVPANTVVVGNPARIIRTINR